MVARFRSGTRNSRRIVPCASGDTIETNFAFAHSHVSELKSKDSAAGARSQKEARESFQKHFHAGYVATGIEARRGCHRLHSGASRLDWRGLRLPGHHRPEEFED